jgi:hypothetical protein
MRELKVARATGTDASIRPNQISGCRRFSPQGFPVHHLGKACGGKVRADECASTRLFPPARPCIRNVGRPESRERQAITDYLPTPHPQNFIFMLIDQSCWSHPQAHIFHFERAVFVVGVFETDPGITNRRILVRWGPCEECHVSGKRTGVRTP